MCFLTYTLHTLLQRWLTSDVLFHWLILIFWSSWKHLHDVIQQSWRHPIPSHIDNTSLPSLHLQRMRINVQMRWQVRLTNITDDNKTDRLRCDCHGINSPSFVSNTRERTQPQTFHVLLTIRNSYQYIALIPTQWSSPSPPVSSPLLPHSPLLLPPRVPLLWVL